MHKVFVYGTLRNGEAATHALEGYAMVAYEGKDFKFPYAIPNGDRAVYGNIIEVDDADLEQLDKYENVRGGLYVRQRVLVEDIREEVRPWADEEEVWAYIAGPSLFNAVESGDWLSFIDREN